MLWEARLCNGYPTISSYIAQVQLAGWSLVCFCWDYLLILLQTVRHCTGSALLPHLYLLTYGDLCSLGESTWCTRTECLG